MVNYARIQHHIDRGLGKAGQKLGEPFSAYRITSSSNGDFPGGWQLLAQNVPIFRRRISESKQESAMKQGGTLIFQIIGNMEPFLLGDVFQCTDPNYAPGVSYGPGASLLYNTIQFNGIVLASHLPVKEPAGARVERRVGIYRPNPAPATLPDGSNYFKNTQDNNVPLILTAGTFAFGSPGTRASWVPCGFGSTERPAAKLLFPPGVPGMTPAIRYYAYLPPLPGYTPIEGDTLVDEEGSRYKVINPYRQEAGFVGSQMSIERQISQVT